MANTPPPIYEFGPFLLDPLERRLTREGEPIILRNKVFDLLVVLVEHAGQLLSHSQLLELAWGEKYNGSDTKVATTINELRRKLGDYDCIENEVGHGYRFVAPVRVHPRRGGAGAEIERHPPPPGGAVPLGSPFYVERGADAEYFRALAREDSVILLKGPPGIGKTSMLARGVHRAREQGASVALTDFRLIEQEKLVDSESLFLVLAEDLADKLRLETRPHQVWNPYLNPGGNLQGYLQRYVLEAVPNRLVWALDDVDEIFKCRHSSEIFALFRWWHNLRALDPAGPWQRLTLTLAYATDAVLFIADLNQSPFNVGTQVSLHDFRRPEVAGLIAQYERWLQGRVDPERLYRLLGGHPYLLQRCLFEMAIGKMDFESIEGNADLDAGIFGDHLRWVRHSIEQDPRLSEGLRGFIAGRPLTIDQFYRLRSAGVVIGDFPRAVEFRCGLYSRYLRKHSL